MIVMLQYMAESVSTTITETPSTCGTSFYTDYASGRDFARSLVIKLQEEACCKLVTRPDTAC